MPSYDARRKEVLATFSVLRPQLTKTEIDRIEPQLGPLYDTRDAMLTALLEVVRSEALEDVAPDWKEKSAVAIERFTVPLSRLLDGVTASPDAKLWVEAQATTEAGFFRALDAVGIANARDALGQTEAGLIALIAQLKLKWEQMTDSAKAIEALEADAARKMADILKQAARDGRYTYGALGDATQRLAAAFVPVPELVTKAIVARAKSDGWPDALAEAILRLSSIAKDYRDRGIELGIDAKKLDAIDPAKLTIAVPGLVKDVMRAAIDAPAETALNAMVTFYRSVLPAAQGELFEQLSAYQRGMPNQAVVAGSVSFVRDQVDKFLHESGVDVARTVFDYGDSGTDRWASSVPTDGMKTDAAAWARDARGALKARFDRIVSAFAAFVSANQGRFIGVPSREVENQILNTDAWDGRIADIVAIDLDTGLKDWRSGLETVSTAATAAAARAFAELRSLPADVADRAKRTAEDIWDDRRDDFTKQTLQVLASLNAAEEKVADSALQRALERSELRRRLGAR